MIKAWKLYIPFYGFYLVIKKTFEIGLNYSVSKSVFITVTSAAWQAYCVCFIIYLLFKGL